MFSANPSVSPTGLKPLDGERKGEHGRMRPRTGSGTGVGLRGWIGGIGRGYKRRG